MTLRNRFALALALLLLGATFVAGFGMVLQEPAVVLAAAVVVVLVLVVGLLNLAVARGVGS